MAPQPHWVGDCSCAGYLSLQAFRKRANSFFAWMLETAIAGIPTWMMGQRYLQTGNIMAAAIVAGISGIITIFYLFKIATVLLPRLINGVGIFNPISQVGVRSYHPVL